MYSRIWEYGKIRMRESAVEVRKGNIKKEVDLELMLEGAMNPRNYVFLKIEYSSKTKVPLDFDPAVTLLLCSSLKTTVGFCFQNPSCCKSVMAKLQRGPCATVFPGGGVWSCVVGSQ